MTLKALVAGTHVTITPTLESRDSLPHVSDLGTVRIFRYTSPRMNEKAEYHRLNDGVVRQFPAYLAIIRPVDTVLGEIER